MQLQIDSWIFEIISRGHLCSSLYLSTLQFAFGMDFYSIQQNNFSFLLYQKVLKRLEWGGGHIYSNCFTVSFIIVIPSNTNYTWRGIREGAEWSYDSLATSHFPPNHPPFSPLIRAFWEGAKCPMHPPPPWLRHWHLKTWSKKKGSHRWNPQSKR